MIWTQQNICLFHDYSKKWAHVRNVQKSWLEPIAPGSITYGWIPPHVLLVTVNRLRMLSAGLHASHLRPLGVHCHSSLSQYPQQYYNVVEYIYLYITELHMPTFWRWKSTGLWVTMAWNKHVLERNLWVFRHREHGLGESSPTLLQHATNKHSYIMNLIFSQQSHLWTMPVIFITTRINIH